MVRSPSARPRVADCSTHSAARLEVIINKAMVINMDATLSCRLRGAHQERAERRAC